MVVAAAGRVKLGRRVRLPLPPGVKPVLVALWNAAHQLGWRMSEHLHAIRHGAYERCVVCGRWGPMLYRRRTIPTRLEALWGLTPRQAEALARRETSDCAWCGAKLRARRLARVLLDLYPEGDPPRPADSVAVWVKSAGARALRIAEINRIDGLHEQLAALPLLASSDYTPGARPALWSMASGTKT